MAARGSSVGIPSKEVPGANYIYAVSNWHVAVQGGFSVLRVTRTNGHSETFDLGPENWEFDVNAGHDVAVAPLRFGPHSEIKFSMAHVDGFATREQFKGEKCLGVGDDVFMVGRFVDHDGGPTNQPAARFGHVSIGPSLLMTAHGKLAETICLDTNSRTGFSGSPVYVYRTMMSDLEQLMDPKNLGTVPILKHPTMILLGVHTGQFPEWWDWRKDESGMVSRGHVRGVSGMTTVAPAWAIRDLLDGPKLREERETIENAMCAKSDESEAAATREEAAKSFGSPEKITEG